jgi:hypothetical protein
MHVQSGCSDDVDYPSFDCTMEGLSMMNAELGDMNMGLDVDMNAYMQGLSMDIGNGFHFGRSPEWFYDVNGWAAGGNFESTGNGD